LLNNLVGFALIFLLLVTKKVTGTFSRITQSGVGVSYYFSDVYIFSTGVSTGLGTEQTYDFRLVAIILNNFYYRYYMNRTSCTINISNVNKIVL